MEASNTQGVVNVVVMPDVAGKDGSSVAPRTIGDSIEAVTTMDASGLNPYRAKVTIDAEVCMAA